MGRLFFCPQSSTLTSAPSGMENGYLPGRSSAASITARSSSGSTACTTNTETPPSPILTLSPTLIATQSSIIEHMVDTFEPRYEVDGRVVPDPLRLYPVPDGMAEPAPVSCRHGHKLGPKRMTVGWVSCPIPDVRGGHRTHTCLRCEAMGKKDPTIYTPRQDEDCPCKEGTRSFGGT